MQVRIGDVLNRRSDLSTFVVHLTKDTWSGLDASANLRTILDRQRIEARTAMGWAKDACRQLGPDAEQSQHVVCFSETPLDSVQCLASEIAGRAVELKPFGLAFTKMVARRKGVNPVWYVDMTYGHDWNIAKALDALRAGAVSLGDVGFCDHPASQLLPFFEGMGTWKTSQKEFWWEREWRSLGDFEFGLDEVAIIIAPEEEHSSLVGTYGRPCLDSAWNMERMIASLVGLGPADVSPFPSYSPNGRSGREASRRDTQASNRASRGARSNGSGLPQRA